MRISFISFIFCLITVSAFAQENELWEFFTYVRPKHEYNDRFKIFQELGLKGKVKEVKVSRLWFSDSLELDFTVKLNKSGEMTELIEYETNNGKVHVSRSATFDKKLIVRDFLYDVDSSFYSFYSYDKDGKLIKYTTSSTEDGKKPSRNVTCHYYSDGRLMSWVDRGKLTSHFTYEGDSVVWQRWVTVNGELVGLSKLVRKSEEQPLRIIYYDIESTQNNGRAAVKNYRNYKRYGEIRFEWNQAGRMIHKQWLSYVDDVAHIDEEEFYSYENDLMTHMILKHARGDISLASLFYDLRGRLVRKEVNRPIGFDYFLFDEDGDKIKEDFTDRQFYYRYVRDHHGNKVERWVTEDQETTLVERRVISYYD